MDLQQYERMKSQLAEILRAATMRPLSGQQRDQDTVRDLFSWLAEDRFNLVVVGRFSRGKTSLMNAMLGTDRLPTGIVPVTSVITTVSYGTVEQVVLYYQHTSLFFEIPIAQLADHITERGNPGNMRRIRTAEVQLPAELLRRGFHFIDTPGLGSSIIENTRTTEAFLPEADAFILVTSYDSPLSEEEQRILETVRRSGRRSFIVVNKQDCVDSAQRQQVTEHLHSRLPTIFGDDLPPLFSVSAQQALTARLRDDATQLAASGLPVLEAALLDFLINAKRREFLLNMSARIAAILDRQAGSDADAARLRGLRAEIEAVRPTSEPAELSVPSGASISPTLPACEICERVADAIFDFLARYQYELLGDRQVQADLAERRGLCGPHTWQFEGLAAPREVCSGFANVVERQAARIRAAARTEPTGALACQAVDAALPTAETCPACDVARQAAAQTAAEAAGRLVHNPAGELGRLSAICLPHLRLLLDALGISTLVKDLLLRQADLLDRFSEDMRRFALKRDAVRRDLTSKEEIAAGQRALRVLVGDPRAQTGPAGPRMADNVTPLARRLG